MAKQPSLMERFFEQARYALKKMGDGFEAANKAEHPYTRQLPAPTPPKRKYPH
ncbi:MAG: hypothetical protein HND56_08055 [Pseudomonadota bacterium]|jgi:hypothetical protein|nr:MAG: hypothetical protein HND56_08055 [Pseudomonadota bacterium]|tara:strand:+ start:1646 stop:1804 length:159 start_codon:yes stop_codon:yes gene_type:complete